MILYYFKKVSVSVSLEFLLGNRWKHYAGGTVFQVFGNPDETCGTSFLKELLKSTSGIKKMEMFRNFSHLVMKNSNMCHWYSNQEMSSLEFDALLKSRVWRRIKLVDNASFQCFTRISNHMQMAKLISLGWTITLWKIKWPYVDLCYIFFCLNGMDLSVTNMILYVQHHLKMKISILAWLCAHNCKLY